MVEQIVDTSQDDSSPDNESKVDIRPMPQHLLTTQGYPLRYTNYPGSFPLPYQYFSPTPFQPAPKQSEVVIKPILRKKRKAKTDKEKSQEPSKKLKSCKGEKYTFEDWEKVLELFTNGDYAK